MSTTSNPTNCAAGQTMALRKAYAISLYAVDCLRIGMTLSPNADQQRFLAACMDSLADIQECIEGVFPNDKSLGD